MYFLKNQGALPPTHTACQPPLVGAAPLLTYARQTPFVSCENLTDPNTLCLYKRYKEKMRAANIYLDTFPLYRPKSRQMDFVMEDQLIGYNIVVTYNITIHI